jgi:hypothetical protein
VDKPLEMLKQMLHGAPAFSPGQWVTVTRPIEGAFLVDRGMLSTSVAIPLRPGDKLEYRGPHQRNAVMLKIPESSAADFLARIVKETERS